MARDLSALFSEIGRPSIAQQMLLRALLLQAFYSVRCERQRMERRSSTSCFAGSSDSARTSRRGMPRASRRTATACWRAMWPRLLATLLARPRVKRLLSSDHFNVDGTMIQAWSSMKSVKPIAGPGAGLAQDLAIDRRRPRAGATPRRTSAARRAPARRTPRPSTPAAELYRKGLAWRRSSPSSVLP